MVVGEVDEEALTWMRKEGYNIRMRASIEERYLEEAGILFCDEEHQPTPEQLQNAGRLKVVGCFGKISNRRIADTACDNGIIIFDDPNITRAMLNLFRKE